MRKLLLATVFSALCTASALACKDQTASLSMIDKALAETKLSEVELGKAQAPRAEVAKLLDGGNVRDALRAQEQAMEILGYERPLTRSGCGNWHKKG